MRDETEMLKSQYQDGFNQATIIQIPVRTQ